MLANTSSQINDRMKDRYYKMARLAEERGMEAVAEKMALTAFSERFQKEKPELMRLFKQVNSERSLRGFFNICQAQANFSSITHLLQSIEISTLIIAGEKDKVVPKKLTNLLHQALRNSEIVTIQEAGHSTYLEQPERFNTILMSFLKNVGH